jgi:hypothetical protein
MASSDNIVALYMASAEKEPEEEAANITELAQRKPPNTDSLTTKEYKLGG